MQIKVKVATGFWESIWGLIGKKYAYPLLLKTRFGIHTFGLAFPIDVLILNKENYVVAIKEDLQPRKVFLWIPIYQNVLELPAGLIRDKHIHIGTKITMIYDLL